MTLAKTFKRNIIKCIKKILVLIIMAYLFIGLIEYHNKQVEQVSKINNECLQDINCNHFVNH